MKTKIFLVLGLTIFAQVSLGEDFYKSSPAIENFVTGSNKKNIPLEIENVENAKKLKKILADARPVKDAKYFFSRHGLSYLADSGSIPVSTNFEESKAFVNR